jgi:glycosyltransferase involved in cell wall biosynthesis
VNFAANTGYAWDFIEALYAGVADRLAARGIRTWVAYPLLGGEPRTLRRSVARAVELDTRVERWRNVISTLRFVRREKVKVVYLADRPAWHPVYLGYRLAGIRRVVVHDHTSGQRTEPRGLKRIVKWLSRRAIPSMLADTVIAVSDYVVERKTNVDLIPRARVRRLWNAVAAPAPNPQAAARLRGQIGVAADVSVVACACRAARYKGVEHLLRAFDRLTAQESRLGEVVLVYMGDGPDRDRLDEIRASLRGANRVIFTGYRSDAAELLEGADVCVVPSVWQEAFGLAALEPMAHGVPVIASRVGGIPEVVLHEETGLLVPPGDETALASALERLLADPAERKRLGENGRKRAAAHFSLEAAIDQLSALVEAGFRQPERRIR